MKKLNIDKEGKITHKNTKIRVIPIGLPKILSEGYIGFLEEGFEDKEFPSSADGYSVGKAFQTWERTCSHPEHPPSSRQYYPVQFYRIKEEK